MLLLLVAAGCRGREGTEYSKPVQMNSSESSRKQKQKGVD